MLDLDYLQDRRDTSSHRKIIQFLSYCDFWRTFLQDPDVDDGAKLLEEKKRTYPAFWWKFRLFEHIERRLRGHDHSWNANHLWWWFGQTSHQDEDEFFNYGAWMVIDRLPYGIQEGTESYWCSMRRNKRKGEEHRYITDDGEWVNRENRACSVAIEI
jgi:hypothetical protein